MPPKSDLRDELNHYLCTDPEHVTDAFVWWYSKWFIYPRLHHMALDYLTIPGEFQVTFVINIFSLVTIILPVDVERVFSQGRLLLLHIHSCLSLQSTHVLMCLGVWSQLGFVTNLDE